MSPASYQDNPIIITECKLIQESDFAV